MSEERNQTDARNTAETPSDGSMKVERVPDHQEDPPLVTATPIPMEPTTIVVDAEAVNESVTVTAQVLDETDRTTSYIDATPSTTFSVPMMDPRSTFLNHQTSSLSSSYSNEEVLSRQESVPVTHEVVQIDAAEDASEGSSTQSYQEEDQQQKLDRMQRYCKIYLAVALIMFTIGTIGLVVMGFNLGPVQVHQPLVANAPSPTVAEVPTPAPINASPSTAKPTVSMVPSQMPSCSGLYRQVASVRVAQSGSNHFTMSEQGDTIAVANFNFQQSRSFLETFTVKGKDLGVIRTESVEGYSLSDMRVSGDGSTLVLGVNTYAQFNDEVGGALLVLEKVDFEEDGIVDWRIRRQLLTGGGSRGAVIKVATSSDGMTVAFAADIAGEGYYVEVYRDNYESSNELQLLGQRIIDTAFDGNTVVALSGDGSRLFVATSDNQVKAFEYVNETWVQLGGTMHYDGISPEVHPSHNGMIVALGSPYDFPVSVFEVHEDATSASWYEVGRLDITTSSQGQHVALSGDGRNVVVSEKFANQQTLARLFRRSGSVFAPVQDMIWQDGIFRGMSLDVGGEQLVVAVDESVSTYRKDCSAGN